MAELISREEKNLLARVGRHLRDEIEREEVLARAAPGAVAGSKHWSLRDRLLRDERDLQALRRRLEAGVPAGLPLAPSTSGVSGG